MKLSPHTVDVVETEFVHGFLELRDTSVSELHLQKCGIQPE